MLSSSATGDEEISQKQSDLKNDFLNKNLLEEESDFLDDDNRPSEKRNCCTSCILLLTPKNPLTKVKPRNGRLSTIFLIINTMIGSGILNQGQVFAEAGIILTLVMYAVGVTCIWFGVQLLIQAAIAHKKFSYTELANHAFGRTGDVFTDGCVVLGNFGALLSYLTVIGGQLSNMLESAVGTSNRCTSELFILPVVTFVFILPWCLTRLYGHFVAISVVSITAIASVMLTVLIAAPMQASAHSHDALNWVDFPGSLRKFGSALFSLSYAYAAFHAFTSMKHKTEEAWRAATVPAAWIGVFMCGATGLFGYISFRQEVQGDILDNFAGPFFYFVKLLVIIHLILYIPLDFVVLRYSLCKLLNVDLEKMSLTVYISLTVALLSFTCFVVMIIYQSGTGESNGFGYILDLTGGITAPLLGFVAPGAIFLKLMPRDSSNWYLACGLLIFGVTVAIICPCSTIVAMV